MSAANGAGYGTDGFTEPWGLARDAAEQGDEADEAFGGMVARMDMPPHARDCQHGRGHRFAAYPRCSTDKTMAREIATWRWTECQVNGSDAAQQRTTFGRALVACASHWPDRHA